MLGWNLRRIASDEIKSASPIPTKSDFIAKRFHPTQVGFLPPSADLVEKITHLSGRQMCDFFWWNRRELNPCPKTSWYNLLRGQSYLLKFPSASADRQAIALVALLCLTDTRAKSRFRFTTNLTHGGSRSPHPRYGRRLWPRHSLRCKSNSVVVVYF